MTTRDNVLLYSQLKKRAGKALPTPTGSNQKPEPVKEVESMAAQTNNTDVFFLQLPQKAMRNLDRVVALWMAGRETRRAA